MNRMNRKRSLVGFALVCTTTLAAGSVVASPDDFTTVESTSVHYHKAQLAQPEAAATLYRRIQRAARRVCHEPDVRELEVYAKYEQCFEGAVDKAVANVDVSALTALHRKAQRSAPG